MNVSVPSMTVQGGMSFTIHRVIGIMVSLMISFTDRVISTGGEPFGGVIRSSSKVDLEKAAFHPDRKFKPHETKFYSAPQQLAEDR